MSSCHFLFSERLKCLNECVLSKCYVHRFLLCAVFALLGAVYIIKNYCPDIEHDEQVYTLPLSLSLSHVADILYNFPYIIVLVDRFEIKVHLNECMDKSSTTFLFVSLNGLNLIHISFNMVVMLTLVFCHTKSLKNSDIT